MSVSTQQVTLAYGPDVFRIACPEVPGVAGTGPIEGNRDNLGVDDLVEVQRPGFVKVREVVTTRPLTLLV